MKHWKMVEYAISEDIFAEAWEKMRTTYAHKQEAINYLANTWLVHKEKFVSAWADRHLHFGSKNTSRVEGANSVLKQYLDTSISDLDVVLERAKLAVDSQYQELRTLELSEKTRTLHFATQPIFSNLVGNSLCSEKDQQRSN